MGPRRHGPDPIDLVLRIGGWRLECSRMNEKTQSMRQNFEVIKWCVSVFAEKILTDAFRDGTVTHSRRLGFEIPWPGRNVHCVFAKNIERNNFEGSLVR
jgi:hypothetical protein